MLTREEGPAFPRLLSAARAAALCDISRSAWWKLVPSGRAPKPVKLGRSTRWPLGALTAWIAAGCPPRDG